jgi:hypothetical protein
MLNIISHICVKKLLSESDIREWIVCMFKSIGKFPLCYEYVLNALLSQ